jgi:hypothetical protein
MVPTILCYPIALLALVWRFLMLQAMWSSDRSVACRPPPQAIAPPRQRSHESNPFAGLTDQPQWAPCVPVATPPTAPPAIPLDPMPVSTRRPRRVETSLHVCAHPTWEDWGWGGLGTRRAHGHPHGGPWRQLQCRACGGDGVETYGTI